MQFRSLRRYTRIFFGGALGLYSRVVLGLLRVLGCFGFWFWAPLYTFCVPRGIDGLGFLCMLEALCAVLVYLEALDAFFDIIH
jgi:hypothetical protein